MTTAQQEYDKRKDNYSTNCARMVGFFTACMDVYGRELMKEKPVWTAQEMGEKMVNMGKLIDLWFEKRYEGPYMSADIAAMLEAPKS